MNSATTSQEFEPRDAKGAQWHDVSITGGDGKGGLIYWKRDDNGTMLIEERPLSDHDARIYAAGRTAALAECKVICEQRALAYLTDPRRRQWAGNQTRDIEVARLEALAIAGEIGGLA